MSIISGVSVVGAVWIRSHANRFTTVLQEIRVWIGAIPWWKRSFGRKSWYRILVVAYGFSWNLSVKTNTGLTGDVVATGDWWRRVTFGQWSAARGVGNGDWEREGGDDGGTRFVRTDDGWKVVRWVRRHCSDHWRGRVAKVRKLRKSHRPHSIVSNFLGCLLGCCRVLCGAHGYLFSCTVSGPCHGSVRLPNSFPCRLWIVCRAAFAQSGCSGSVRPSYTGDRRSQSLEVL